MVDVIEVFSVEESKSVESAQAGEHVRIRLQETKNEPGTMNLFAEKGSVLCYDKPGLSFLPFFSNRVDLESQILLIATWCYCVILSDQVECYSVLQWLAECTVAADMFIAQLSIPELVDNVLLLHLFYLFSSSSFVFVLLCILIGCSILREFVQQGTNIFCARAHLKKNVRLHIWSGLIHWPKRL